MSKYHISPETGRPNICRASVRDCPIGGANEHYDSKDDARAAYEKQMNEATEHLKSVQKEIADKRNGKMPSTSNSEEEAAIRASGPPMEVFKGNGMHMNPYATEPRDRFVDKDGGLWEVEYVSKPGLYGMSEAAGPSVKLVKMREAGVKSEYRKDVTFGGYNNPDQFEEFDESKVDRLQREVTYWENNPARHQYGFPEDEMIRYNIEEKIKDSREKLLQAQEDEFNADPAIQAANNLSDVAKKEAAENTKAFEDFYSEPSIARKIPRVRNFYQGEHKYDSAAVAEIQYNKTNPGQKVTKAEDAGTKTIIVPNVKRLTKQRRLEIAEEIYKASGRDMAVWNRASEEEKLGFSNMHVALYKDVKLTVTGDSVDYSYDDHRRSGWSKNPEDFSTMHVGPTS